MNTRLKFTDEQQLLDPGFRAAIVKEIIYCPENVERRARELRKHEIYRDMNKKWVMAAIEQEGFKPETVAQMRNRATNISICRKIVNKLAQTYVGGVDRTVGETKNGADGKPIASPDQEAIDKLSDELDFNTHMKKADRYRQLAANTLVMVVPVKDREASRDAGGDRYRLQLRVFAAWEYDVIEDPNDPTKPAVIILSAFPERAQLERYDSDGAQGIRSASSMSLNQLSDGRDSLLADRPEDRESDMKDREFIVWSDSFHFTMDYQGQIIPGKSEPGLANPIGILPGVPITDDQDGNFWAVGGDDVVETSVLINKKLTDVNFISFTQGWGQLVVAARNVPKKLEGGPDNAFIFEKAADEGDVQVFFASSNPPIEQWLETVRMILALCLSTNDLSTRNIAAKLDVVTAPSAVALMVENSESIADAKDVRENFQDREPEIWEIIRRWHEKYHPWLVKEQQEIPPFKDSDVNLKFHELKPPITDKEQLEALKLRKDLGITTLKDLLKRDNPDLTDEEAQAKVEEIQAEKKTMSQMVAGAAMTAQQTGIKNGANLQPRDGAQSATDAPSNDSTNQQPTQEAQ